MCMCLIEFLAEGGLKVENAVVLKGRGDWNGERVGGAGWLNIKWINTEPWFMFYALLSQLEVQPLVSDCSRRETSLIILNVY